MLLFFMELLSQVTVVGVDLYAGGADAGDDVGDEEGQPAGDERAGDDGQRLGGLPLALGL